MVRAPLLQMPTSVMSSTSRPTLQTSSSSISAMYVRASGLIDVPGYRYLKYILEDEGNGFYIH